MNDYLIKTEEYKGFNINVSIDQFTDNPRLFSEHFTKLVLNHRKYDLGNELDFNFKDNRDWEEVEAKLIKEYRAKIILPVYMYDHSGVALKTYRFGQHQNWDCGKVGYIVATAEDIKKEYGVKKISKKLIEKIEKLMVDEIEEYSHYVNGDVYCYTITDNEGNKFDTENFSNNQWYNMEEMIKEAQAEIEYILKNKKELTLQY